VSVKTVKKQTNKQTNKQTDRQTKRQPFNKGGTKNFLVFLLYPGICSLDLARNVMTLLIWWRQEISRRAE